MIANILLSCLDRLKFDEDVLQSCMASHTIPDACFHDLNAVLFIALFLALFLVGLENKKVKQENE